MRAFWSAILIYLIASASGSADEAERISALTDELRHGIAMSFGEDVRIKLSASNLAQSDVDRIVADFAANSAECFVQALIKQAEEQSLDPAELLRRSESGEEYTALLDDEELGRKLEICIGVAFENAGVSLN